VVIVGDLPCAEAELWGRIIRGGGGVDDVACGGGCCGRGDGGGEMGRVEEKHGEFLQCDVKGIP
ncbi:hypothetical protein AKJ16_DCAP11388, partial [Drosera capensis]